VDVIDVVLDGRATGGRPLTIDLGHATIELRAAIGRKRLGTLRATTASAATAACRGRRSRAFDRTPIRGRRRRATPRTAAASASRATAAPSGHSELVA